MIDLKTIKAQSELSKKLFKEIENQNRIFEKTIESVMKGAPESDKPKINQIQMLSQKAINLAKQGKLEDAQNLIKNFRHGNQDS
jgi:hypothetical protein